MTESAKVWNRQFIHLILLESCLQLGQYIQNPIVSNYAVLLGASVSIAGFLVGMNAMISLAMRPISGLTSDLFSKKFLLVMAATLYVLASLGCALSNSVALIGFFRVVQGFGFAFKSVVSVSMVSLVVPPAVVGRAMGWYGAAYTITSAIGPGIGSWAGATAGYSISFVVAAIVQLVGLVLAISFRAPSLKKHHHSLQSTYGILGKGRIRKHLPRLKLSKLFDISVLSISATAAMTSMPFVTTTAFMLLIGEMRDIDGVYLYFTVYAFVAVVAKPLAGRINDRFGIKTVVVPTMLLTVTGMVVLAFSYKLPMVLAGAVCMGAGQGSLYSSLQAEAVRGVEESKVGRAANTFFVGPDLGMWLGPFISGVLFHWFGITTMFLFNAVVALLGLMIFLLSRRSAMRNS